MTDTKGYFFFYGAIQCLIGVKKINTQRRRNERNINRKLLAMFPILLPWSVLVNCICIKPQYSFNSLNFSEVNEIRAISIFSCKRPKHDSQWVFYHIQSTNSKQRLQNLFLVIAGKQKQPRHSMWAVDKHPSDFHKALLQWSLLKLQKCWRSSSSSLDKYKWI